MDHWTKEMVDRMREWGNVRLVLGFLFSVFWGDFGLMGRQGERALESG